MHELAAVGGRLNLRNRVTPFSDIIAELDYRGGFMGNRGCLHDDHRTIVRRQARPAWIICLLEFKDRKRQLMTPDEYTELFFLDEATALAAGHRPCGECQRSRLNEFREALIAGGQGPLSAGEMNDRLDIERRHGNVQLRHPMPGADVPEGAMIAINDTAYLMWRRRLLKWSARGYSETTLGIPEQVHMLTPPLTAQALRNGYKPMLHESAGGK